MGTNEINNSQISLFPNPTQSSINIKFSEDINSVGIEVFDILGEKIFEQLYVNQKMVNLELGEHTGLFFIRLKTDNGIARTYKVVKN